MAGENGDVYHYDYFDARTESLHAAHPLSPRPVVVAAERGDVCRQTWIWWTDPRMGAREATWLARAGWVRTVSTRRTAGTVKTVVVYEPFAERQMRLEAPGYFKTESPDALKMTYGQLSDYIEQLTAADSTRCRPPCSCSARWPSPSSRSS